MMEFLQEIALSHGCFPYNNYQLISDHSAMEAALIFPNAFYTGLLSPDQAEGMDETNLLQPATTLIPPINDSISASSLGLCTKQKYSEISNSSFSHHLPGKIKRRSWQEALSSPVIQPMINTDATYPEAGFSTAENILNLQHMEAAASTYTDPNLIPASITSATVELPLEESLIAVHERALPGFQGELAEVNLNKKSHLSALNRADTAFFRQQLLVPMEGCIDYPMKQSNLRTNQHDHDTNVVHVFENHPTFTIWGQESSLVTDPSRHSLAADSKSTGLSCATVIKEDNEMIRAKKGSDHSCSWALGGRLEEGLAVTGPLVNDAGKGHTTKTDDGRKNKASDHMQAESKKRPFDGNPGCMANSKRAHLGPHVTYSNNVEQSNRTASLVSGSINGAISTSNSSKSGKLRNPLGPALNTNFKPRARQGTANDPQTLAARNRRERINARLKVLQELVPNGSKVDLVTMLEKAINYVKFLQLQLRVLSNDDYWQGSQEDQLAMQNMCKSEEEDNSTQLTACDSSVANYNAIKTRDEELRIMSLP